MPHKLCSPIKFWGREAGKSCSDLVEDLSITDIESAQEIGHCGLWFKELVFTLEFSQDLCSNFLNDSSSIAQGPWGKLCYPGNESSSYRQQCNGHAFSWNSMNIKVPISLGHDLNENYHLHCYAWPTHSYKTDMVSFIVKAVGIFLHSIDKKYLGRNSASNIYSLKCKKINDS